MSANKLGPSIHSFRERDAACDVARRLLSRMRRDADADAWHALGVVLLQLGERVAATMAFRNASRLDEGRLRSHVALGNLLFDAGQCERALTCFSLGASAMTRGAP